MAVHDRKTTHAFLKGKIMKSIIDWILDAATLNGQEILVVTVLAVVAIVIDVAAIVALYKTFDFPDICADKEENDD